jgi:hypothetical protein
VLGIAGGFSYANNAAIGVGFELGSLDGKVKATVADGASITAAGDVTVAAADITDIRSFVVSISVSTGDSGLGAAGTATVWTVTKNVEASINATGTIGVAADGSVTVDADERLDLSLLAGTGAGGSNAGAGIAGALSFVDRTTTAKVGDGARVVSKGNGAGIVDPSGSATRRGLAVDASSHESTILFALAGAAGINGFAGSASVVVPSTTSRTSATIGKNAKINWILHFVCSVSAKYPAFSPFLRIRTADSTALRARSNLPSE